MRNLGGAPMENLTVRFMQQEEHYGTLQPGAVSEYRTVQAAHRYAFSEAIIGGARHVLQPMDFFGEPFLPLGDYTWGFSPAEGARLDLKLTRD